MRSRYTPWVVLLVLAVACTDPPAALRSQVSTPSSLPDRLRLTSPPPRVVAITDATVIDVVSGARRERVTVVVTDGRISSVGRGTSIPSEAARLDGAGKFIIPGLWDMHAHHEAVGPASLDLFVANGVVGTRDMGAQVDFVIPLRDRINRGELLGPEIVAAGPILDSAPADWPFRRRITGASDAREAVRNLKERGVDFVKVHDQTPREAFFAIADEAVRLGLPMSGHVPRRVTVEEAAKTGLRSLEQALTVLLVSAANVANLFLARGVARRREFAARGALGASSWDIARLVLVEVSGFTLLGIAAGLLVTAGALAAVATVIPAQYVSPAGLVGVVAFVVARRTREMAIRVAVGATAFDLSPTVALRVE